MRIVCYLCREHGDLKIIGVVDPWRQIKKIPGQDHVPLLPDDTEIDGLCAQHSVLFVAEARVWLAHLGPLTPLEATRGAPEPPAPRVQEDAA
jgi:hypothetical protein